MFLLAIVVEGDQPRRSLANAMGTGAAGNPSAPPGRGPDHGRSAMNFLQQASYLLTAATGPVQSAWQSAREHLEYTAVAVAASALDRRQSGCLSGTLVAGRCCGGCGQWFARFAHVGRSAARGAAIRAGISRWWLMLLGILPLLASTYAGTSSADPLVVDAARAMTES